MHPSRKIRMALLPGSNRTKEGLWSSVEIKKMLVPETTRTATKMFPGSKHQNIKPAWDKPRRRHLTLEREERQK